jgi:hypothetical protein
MNTPADHTGEVFNNRIIIERAADTVTPRRRFKCGKEIVVTQRMRNWKVRCLSCGEEKVLGWQGIRLKGCFRCTIKALKSTAGRAALARVRCAFRTGARARGYEWALDDATVERLVFSPCHYCGDPGGNTIRRMDRGHAPTPYNGIDRMDNARGYVEGNVVSCCGACNRAKGVRSYADFVAWLDRIAQFRHKALAERAA